MHVYAEGGLNARRLRRQRYRGLHIIPAALADELPVLIVALSGNGAVADPSELRANLEWLRAEYPRARISCVVPHEQLREARRLWGYGNPTLELLLP